MKRLAITIISVLITLGLLTACGSDGGPWYDSATGLTWQNPPANYIMNLAGAKGYCDRLSLDGHSDWRLPNISELRTLIRGCSSTESSGNCNIDLDDCLESSCMRNPCRGCASEDDPDDVCFWPDNMDGSCGWYWSSSPIEDIGCDTWSVRFSSGRVSSIDRGNGVSVSATGPYHNEVQGNDHKGGARCVRDDTTHDDTSPVDGDTEPADKPWYDATSGLTWQNPPAGQDFVYYVAMDYCYDLNLGGHCDWRAPNISELRSLIRGCSATESSGSCNIAVDDCLEQSCRDDSCNACSNENGPDDGCYWPDGMEGRCGWYWSSSRKDNEGPWPLNFSSGKVAGSLTEYNDVRCVRLRD